MADSELEALQQQLGAARAEVARLQLEELALKEELRATEQRLGFTVSSAKLAWWEWDIEVDRLRRFGADPWFLGFPPEQSPRSAREWHSYVHPDDLPVAGVPSPLERNESEWTEEIRVRQPDGSFRWVRNRACVSERDPTGRPLRVLGTTQDIHDEKVSSEARRLAEETTRRDAQALGQLQDAVVCTDKELRITAWNGAAERMLQWAHGERLGRSICECMPSAGARVVEECLRSVVDRGRAAGLEWEDYRRDGSRVWIDWHSQAVTDAEGSVVGTVSIGRDVTERRQAERKQRTLELQLFHAQKMETMGLLAGGIAHDFNNILTVILMLAELGAGGRSASVEDTFQDIRKSGLRAKDLVRRILTFSRPSDPERTAMSISSVVEEAVKFVRAALSTTIELNVELLADCPTVLGDSNQIQHLLINLVSNAAFAMPRGGTLSLRVRERKCRRITRIATGELPPGPYLAIEVEDTGTGIPEAALSKIFDTFFTTKAPGEGTGLGLPIVRGIAEEHGGGVDVQSALGKGSLFTLYLPAVSSEGRTLAIESGHGQAPRGRGERVLIVDDEETIAVLTRSALEGLGYAAQHTTSPEQFLREFEDNAGAYDLLIVDHTMPRITGLELAERMRSSGHAQPVIIATGFSGRLPQSALDRLPNTVVLEKPFGVGELALNIHRLLQGRTAMGEL